LLIVDIDFSSLDLQPGLAGASQLYAGTQLRALALANSLLYEMLYGKTALIDKGASGSRPESQVIYV